MADSRTTAELADALEARARELDNVEPHSGLDHDPRCIADAALEAHDRLAAPARTYADGLRAAAEIARGFTGTQAVVEAILESAEKDGQ